jgi:YrbI family 3-deoxy-D-manno-octulosonate 8-phosphate phosphatase
MIAIIPLRAGSKSIPHKNTRVMAGRPLATWVIAAALDAQSVERVILSTDDPIVVGLRDDMARAWGADRVVVHHRSASTATDTATTESALIEVAQTLDQGSIVCLLQATSPLTTSDDIDAAAAVFGAGGFDSLLSVVPQHRFVWSQGDGGAHPVNYDPRSRPRRQEMSPLLVENGAIYITRRDELLATGSRLSGRIATYQMDAGSYMEIDEPQDWSLVESLIRARQVDGLGRAARRVRLVLTDVDGVLTDAGMYLSSDGTELKKFNARDGKGFELLRLAGIATGMLTSEAVELVAQRARKLGTHVALGCADKLAEADRLRLSSGLTWDEIAYIGDDVHDLELMASVGLSAAPCDAVPVVRSAARYVTQAAGGKGSFRELADLILAAQ